MKRVLVVGLLMLGHIAPVSAATYLGNLISRVPADTGGVYRRAANGLLVVDLVYQNVGTNDWTAAASQSGFVVVVPFDSTLTTPTPSPLANNWLSSTRIATITPNNVIGTSADPARETSLWVRWNAPGDDGWNGRAVAYDLRSSLSPITAANWVLATQFLAVPTPSASGQLDSCRVTGLQPQTMYSFALTTRDDLNNWSSMSNVATATTATSRASVRLSLRMPSVPGRYSLTCALTLAATGQIISSGLRLNFDVIGDVAPPSTSVDAVPFAGQFTRDLNADIGFWNRSNDQVTLAAADTIQRRFNPMPLPTPWSSAHGADSLFARQFVGDSLSDLCVHLPNGDWFVATNTGSGLTVSTTPFLRGFGVNRTPIAADFNADGLCDVGYFNPDSLAFFVALNRSGTRFEPVNGPAAGGAWWVSTSIVPKPFVPMTGRFNADRYEDAGMRNFGRAEWFVGMSNGAKFVASAGSQADGSWLATWPEANSASPGLIGRVTPDTLDDIVSVLPSGLVRVARSSGTGFLTTTDWLSSWAPDSSTRRTLLADVSADRRAELVSYSRTTGRWYVARNTSTAFTPWLGAISDGAWVEGFGTQFVAQSPTLDVNTSHGSGPALRLVSRNPFTTSVSIGGNVGEPGPVAIAVYDVTGRLIDQFNSNHSGGFWMWTWAPAQQPAGVYLLRCSFPQGSSTVRVVYLH